MSNILFKWAGNKRKMMDRYLPYFFPQGKTFDTFVDGFAGSAYVSKLVSTLYPDVKIVINDTNTEIIQLYRDIAYNTDEFLQYYHYYVSEFLYTDPDHDLRKGYYYSVRDMYCLFPHEFDQVCLSAMLLFMLKINFNGIWKQYIKMNLRYSTPPGGNLHKVKSEFFNKETVKEYAEFFRKCDIYNVSYDQIPLGDYTNILYYADPPYRDTSINYNSGSITTDEQQRGILEYLYFSGYLFSISNLDNGDNFFQNLCSTYGLTYEVFDYLHTAKRSIKGGTKDTVREIILKNF